MFFLNCTFKSNTLPGMTEMLVLTTGTHLFTSTGRARVRTATAALICV